MRIHCFVLAKDEAHNLPGLVDSVRPAVKQVVVLADVDSRDGTVEVARKVADRVYPVRFPGSFSALLNMGVHLCQEADYALWLDGDERLCGKVRRLGQLVDQAEERVVAANGLSRVWPGTAFALERARVLPGPDRRVIERDMQPRLIPAWTSSRFSRAVHPRLDFPAVEPLGSGVCEVWIDHHHDAKTEAQLAERAALYRALAAQDQVAVEGGEPLLQRCQCEHFRGSHAGAHKYAKPPFACEIPDCRCRAFNPKELDQCVPLS